MEAEKTFKIACRSIFTIFIALVDILFKSVILVGACSAILILINLFPDVAKSFINPLISLITFLVYSVIVLLILMSSLGYIGVIIILAKKNKIKREENKKKFIKELTKKLKKELNK